MRSSDNRSSNSLRVNTAPARVESTASGATGGSVTTPVKPAGYSATLSNAGIRFAITISPGVNGTNQVTVATTKGGKPFDPIDITATLTQTAQNAKLAVPLKSEGKGTGTAQGNVDLPIAGKYRLEVRALYTDVDEAVVSDNVQIL